jgi:hypothetical protein
MVDGNEAPGDRERLAALGDPEDGQDDFASEHSDTTVGDDPGAAGDTGLEPESPSGLGGMD